MNRRSFVQAVGVSALGLTLPAVRRVDHTTSQADGVSRIGSVARRAVTIEASPSPIRMDVATAAVLVVDMQNDFGAEGGAFHRAGIDISMIRAAVPPTVRVLSAARTSGVKIVYLKMAFRPDLSDAGAPEAPNHLRHLRLGLGQSILAPNGTASRMLIRDTWNTDILTELAPAPDDVVVYKHRFSGFYQTDLDAILKRAGVTHLVVVGCTTSVCVESTIRDAMFRDYSCVLLEDCTGEPIGHGLSRSNHEASLLAIQTFFGWVSSSRAFVDALDG